MPETPDAIADDVQTFPIGPMDGLFRATTVGVLATLVVVPLGIQIVGMIVTDRHVWTGWIIAGVVWLVIAGISWAIWRYGRPTCFEVSAEGLKIIWPGRTRKLPRGAFTDMRRVNRAELGFTVRCFGAGGLFGTFGWIRSEYLGNLDAYITGRERMVYLRLVNRRSLLLTPEDPGAFLEALRAVTERKDADRRD